MASNEKNLMLYSVMFRFAISTTQFKAIPYKSHKYIYNQNMYFKTINVHVLGFGLYNTVVERYSYNNFRVVTVFNNTIKGGTSAAKLAWD